MNEDHYSPETHELASKADRLWFKAHPERRHRLRQALAGELPGVTAERQVIVRQILPLLRVRCVLPQDVPLPVGDAPESVARALFERFDRNSGLHLRGLEAMLRAHPVVQEQLARLSNDRDADYPLPHPDPAKRFHA